jgi:sec-independent protein translocase protein TatA
MGLDNPLHIAFLVVILLLVFGAKRLPEIGRSLGSGMREFKQSITGESGQQTALSPPQQPQAINPPAQAAPPASAPQPAPAAQAPAAAAATPEQARAAEQQQA